MPDEVITEELPKPAALAVQRPAPAAPMREMLTVLKETGDPELFKAFARDIIQREVARARFGEDSQLAMVFAGSGAFDGIDGSERGVSMAMTKIQMGRSWNMEPSDAMESIFFINGRPSVATKYISAKIQDAGIGWDIEWLEEKDVCVGCRLHLKRWNPSTGKYDPITERVNGTERQAMVSFTKRDADQAMVHEKGKMIKLSEKWNFQSWSADMYFARCVSRVRTRYCPNVLSGVLTREEAEDSVTVDTAPLAIAAARDTATTDRAATATQQKQESVANQLKERKAASAGAAVPAVTATTPPAATTATPPWSDRAGMNSKINAEKRRVGEEVFSKIQSEHGILLGSLEYTDLSAMAFYASLTGTVDGAVKDEDPF